MPEQLTDDALATALAALSDWQGDATAIRRTAELPSFPAAIEVVRKVADVAENMNHHPDIEIRYSKLTFACSTHSAGGVTELDIELARSIDEIVAAHT